jgi:hypothetical protein
MSPKKKPPRYVTRRSHASQRHGASPPAPEQPTTPEPAAAAPSEAAGRILANLVERLGADGAYQLVQFSAELADRSYADVAMMLTTPAAPPIDCTRALDDYLTRCWRAAGVAEAGVLLTWIEQRAAEQRGALPAVSAAWMALGTSIAAAGPHRLALAAHVAAQNTLGPTIAAEEEEEIVRYFGDAIERAVALTGGPQPNFPGGESRDTSPASAAVWFLLQADRAHGRSLVCRCPAIETVPPPGDAGHLAAMRAGVEGYARTVLSSCTESDLALIRRIVDGAPEEIDELCRPLGTYFGEDCPDESGRDAALENLPRRYATNGEICAGVEGWASWFSDERAEHDIPPVYRLAVIAWLAYAALRGELES